MRPSAVIQGWKSLVDKLNPGLPLTSKESSRLLTALTSSFRKQLDEAHPQIIEPSPSSRPGSETKLPRLVPGLQHSSAVAADRHLSSMLTNPLLNPLASGARSAQGPQARDLAAVREDIKRSGIRAISHFEKLAATLHSLPFELAELCINTFHRTVWEMQQDDQRRAMVRDHQPGRKMLAWLVQQERLRTSVLTDHRRFANRLVSYLTCENRNDLLWSWLAIHDSLRMTSTATDIALPEIPQSQTWRSWLLSYMIDAQLRPPSRQGFNASHSADTAIETILRALALREDARKTKSRSALGQLSLKQPARLIVHSLFDSQHNAAFSKTSSRKYETFLDALFNKIGVAHEKEPLIAMAHLAHPHRPDASRGLRLLHQITDPQTMEDQILRESLTASTNLQRRHWCSLLLRCMAVLDSTHQASKRFHMYATMERLFPERKSDVDKARETTGHEEYDHRRQHTHLEADLSKLSFG